MLDFLKVYPDMMELFEEYTDAEKGRLYEALFKFAFFGEEPNFTGNERFVWKALKRIVEQAETKSVVNKANGSLGGRPPKNKDEGNPNKPTETKNNPAKPNETQSEPKESPNTNANANTNTKANANTNAEAEMVRATITPIIAFDGSDLTLDIQAQQQAERLVMKYMPPCTDAKLEAVAADILDNGYDKVRDALQSAANGDNRGGVSINFYRACLKNAGSPKPSQQKKADTSDYQHRTYSADDFRAMEVDLDAM